MKKALTQSLLLGALVAQFAHESLAATNTWTGGASPDGNWQNAANWGGTAVAAKDVIFFDGGTQLLSTNDFAPGTIFGSFGFTPGASSFSLFGNSFVLTNGFDIGAGQTLGGGITNSSASSQTVSNAITLSAGKHGISTDPGAGQLNLNGTITRTTGSGLSFMVNGSPVNVAGSGLANVNGILGYGAHINTGGVFTDWAALDGGNNVVPYSGYTDVASGALANNAASNVRLTADSGAYTAANGTTVNSILSQITGAARNLTITGVLRLGARGGIFHNSSASQALTVTGGNITTAGGAGGELTFLSKPGTTSGGLSVNSAITNDVGGAPVSVNIQGYVTMNVANSYSGGTFIFNNGRLNGNNSASAGTTGLVTVYPGGQYFFGGNVNISNSFVLSGVGSTETSAGQTMGAIRFSGGTSSIASPATVTLAGDTRISGGSAGSNNILGKITGPGHLELTASTGNSGSIVLSNPNNDWIGGLILNGLVAGRNVFCKVGGNNSIPAGAGKGDIIFNGTPSIVRFDLNGFSTTVNGLSAALSANNQISNLGNAASTLTFGSNNVTTSYGGTIADGGFATNSLSLVKVGSGTQTLLGANSHIGSTTVNGGTLLFGAGATLSGTSKLIVNSNAIVGVSAIEPLTLATNPVTASNGTFVVALVSGGNAITTPTLNSLGATNFITVTAIPAVSTYPAQFTVIKATSGVVGTLNFGLAGALPVSPGTPFAGYVSNNVANNSVDVVITAGPTSIKWAGFDGASLNSSWDTFTTDWKTFGNSLTTYSDNSFVSFDNSASNGTVSVNQTVNPAGITVNNSTLSYTLIGGGGITGAGGLSKQGSGTAVLDNTGVNDFTGGISISAGTLQFGNSDSGGSIPAAGTILNNGTLVFAHGDSITVSNIISGSGPINENGAASGVVKLNSANTFTGPVTISQGTLQLGNNAALGTTNGGTTVTSGGTLDITANSINLGQEQVTVSGNGANNSGALLNSSGNGVFSVANLARLVLAGDATVNASGRLDLRSSNTGDPTLASLSTGGVNRKLTKTGAFQFSIVGVTVDPQLGDIEVQQGSLSIETATTGLGNSASNLTVLSGAALQLFAPTNRLLKNFIFNDGSALSNASGANIVVGPMLLTNSSLSATPNISFRIGGTSLNLSNTLSGNAIINRDALANNLIISGNSPAFAGGIYQNVNANTTLAAGGTLNNALGVLINVGSFTVNGSLLGAGITNSFNSTVSGIGSSAGIADITGNLAPGGSNSVGTLTLGGLIEEGSSILLFDLGYATTPGGTTNDLLNINGDLVMNGGTITINPLALLKKSPANRYRLINYTGSLVNNSTPSVVMPQNYTGTLDFSTTNQVNLLVSGGPTVWDGGSATSSNWSDPANWGGHAINPGESLYFDGTTRVNNINDTAAGTGYQDLSFNVEAGAFTLNGNDIVLNGSLINTSTNAQTVLIPMTSSTPINTFNGGTNGPGSKLIIGGGWTNISSGFTSNTLAGVGILTNIIVTASGTTNTFEFTDTNANWTLMDNASSAGMTNDVSFDMQAGTFSFGQGASAPVMNSTTLVNSRLGNIANQPATFNMVSGTLVLAARLNTGTAGNGIATLNQSGGSLNMSLFQGADGSATAASTENLTGGSLTVGTLASRNTFFVSSRGTGVVNVATSGVLNCGTLDIERGITTNIPGTVNLNSGGLITATRVGTASSASSSTATGDTATFNFNGGTLRAAASSATFFQGNAAAPAIPITTIVKSGGAIIDAATFAISVLEPMQHDASLGVTADGGLTKLGTGTLTLTAASSYTGPTVISNGTLAVNGSIGTNTVTVATNGTLAGVGTINGAVTVNNGGIISPAGAGVAGTLTVSNNVTFQPGSTALMQVNKSLGTNDLLLARTTNATTITLAGTLSVTNIAGTLAAGDSFKLFSATNLSGTFASIQPSQPALGLTWDTTQLYSAGILKIAAVSQPNINSTTRSGGNIVIAGTNGSPGLTYRVLATPDVSIPMANWTILGTNSFDGSGNFQFSIGATNTQQFFRLQAL